MRKQNASRNDRPAQGETRKAVSALPQRRPHDGSRQPPWQVPLLPVQLPLTPSIPTVRHTPHLARRPQGILSAPLPGPTNVPSTDRSVLRINTQGRQGTCLPFPPIGSCLLILYFSGGLELSGIMCIGVLRRMSFPPVHAPPRHPHPMLHGLPSCA